MTRLARNAERLEAVLSGDLAVEDAPRELRSLARLAAQVDEAMEVPGPSDAFRERLRAELLVAPGPDPAPVPAPSPIDAMRSRLARWGQSLRVATATGAVATMVGVTGVAAAAQAALPGDLLYPIKTVTEETRLALADDAAEKGKLHLAFARARLAEVESGLDRLTAEQMQDTLGRLDEDAVDGANLLLADGADAEDGELLHGFTTDIRAGIDRIDPRLPLSVRPSAERTLETLRRIDLELSRLTSNLLCDGCHAAAESSLRAAGRPVARIVLPGEGPAGADCTCVDGTTSGSTPSSSPTGDTVPDTDVDEPEPSMPAESPSGGDLIDDTVDDTTDTVDDTTDTVDDVVDELLEEDTSLDDTVDDTTSELDDTVDDVESTADDLVDDTTDTLLGD